MSRIAIFENEYKEIKDTLILLNLLHFHEKLQFKIYQTSQEFKIEKIDDFDLFLIDIDLSLKSDQDGISLIKTILQQKDIAKIIIITGSSNIDIKMKEKGINDIPIIEKPLDIDELAKAIKIAVQI